ncbi:unnamed protein product, partial [Ectocarpus sp. 8 AP-2014]
MDGGKWERTDTAYRADECITICVRSISRTRIPCSQEAMYFSSMYCTSEKQ